VSKNDETGPSGFRGGQTVLLVIALLGIIGLILIFAEQELPATEPASNIPAVGPTVGLRRQTATAIAIVTPGTESATPATTTAAPTAATAVSGATLTATPVATSTRPSTPVTATPKSGALIAITMNSRVGVLLDELPASMRDQAAASLLAETDEYWLALARQQTRLTTRRLNFRNFAYPGKNQLPLPPEAVWSFTLDPAAAVRETINGHDLVLIGYSFNTTLLTDSDSPAQAEPALALIGGVWHEPYVLPADPMLLLQRTGNACLNEAGYPPNSFDSENAWILYDHTCEPSSTGPLGCHRSLVPNFSCAEAVNNRIGAITTEMRFERLPWSAQLADSVRLGEVSHLEAPDVTAVTEDLAINRIIYRYFPPNSCALSEGCVGGTGWRRLLQFTATVHNIGGVALDIGLSAREDSDHNLFQYDACHDHFHFIHYGRFFLANSERELASKQAFCVQSTGRYSNNEYAPLTHAFSCREQGIQAGWADEYIAGLDCQWIDITDLFTPAPAEPQNVTLGFHFNPDQFLCEGTPQRDEDGNYVWLDTGFTSINGHTIRRPACDFTSDWETNNTATIDLAIPPTGGLVTAACGPGQIGPLRNCGFTERESSLACTPGATVRLSCGVANGGSEQLLRLCESSAVLGVGTACTYTDALLNAIIGRSGTTEVSFSCPRPRDEAEPGGLYAVYTAPVFPADAAQPISCTVIE
jgi:hypothetical protein